MSLIRSLPALTGGLQIFKEIIVYKCPYCATQTLKSGKLFLSWRSVRNHVGQCERRTGDYFIDEAVGPIRYKDLEGLSREQVLFRFPGLKSDLAEIRKSFLRRDIIIDCYEERLTDQQRLEPIRCFYLEHGRIPNMTEIPQSKSIQMYFNGWGRAIELAGYQPKKRNESSNKRKYTDLYLLEQLREFYNEHKRAPKVKDFKNNSKYPSYISYVRSFGSWTHALELAELSQNSTAYTREELVNIGKSWILQYGRTPTSLEFTGSLPSPKTIRKHFDSWNAYIVEIGGTINEGYGRPTQALDGKLYRSRLEARLADWLYTNQISYEYETPYPAPYNRLYDFYLPLFDVYIELDGMGEARSRDTISEKLEINRRLDRKLIVLYPHDLDTITVKNLLTFG